jgi:hypothetical integral membrane protein (TIGR02206 family)
VLGVFLLANEAIWYGYRYTTEGFRFPDNLPLQLCDVMVIVVGLAALTANRWLFEMAYFAGVGGASMALITPDLWAPWPSYPSIYYFVVHAGMVIATLVLIWGRFARPTAAGVWRAFLMANVFAALVGIFNQIFGTNYMYLCNKPASATLLDLFGPWPVYIFVGEAFALGLFWLMWLPFWRDKPAAVHHANPTRLNHGR